MNSTMMATAGAALACATRIYVDELDALMGRHFPLHSERAGNPDYVAKDATVIRWRDGWMHVCDSPAQAEEIAGIMNRSAREFDVFVAEALQ